MFTYAAILTGSIDCFLIEFTGQTLLGDLHFEKID